MGTRHSNVRVALLLAMCIVSGSGQGLPQQPRPAFPSLPSTGPMSRLFQALAPGEASAAGMAPSSEEVQVWQAREEHQPWQAYLCVSSRVGEQLNPRKHSRGVSSSQTEDVNTVAGPILLYICQVGRWLPPKCPDRRWGSAHTPRKASSFPVVGSLGLLAHATSSETHLQRYLQ